MRWNTKNTWIRLGILFAVLLLVPMFFMWAITKFEPTGMLIFMPVLMLKFPIVVIALALWDGLKDGFSLLWAICPFLFFLVPTFLILNESALIYGVIYSVLGIVSNALGAFIKAKRG